MAQDETTSGQAPKQRRGRRLRSPEIIRSMLAYELRRVLADESMKPATRARLVASLSARLLDAIAAADHFAKRDEKVRELERIVARLAAERRQAVS